MEMAKATSSSSLLCNFLGKLQRIDITSLLNVPCSSSLSKRQRELLQAYADDVEGVSSNKAANKEKGSRSEKTEPLSTDNGEVYFNRKPPSLGAWLVQGLDILRQRLGKWNPNGMFPTDEILNIISNAFILP